MSKLLAVLVATGSLVMVAAAPAHAQRYYYVPGYYFPQSYYYNGMPAPVADPAGPCYWQRQRMWDGAGWRIRSVRVCG